MKVEKVTDTLYCITPNEGMHLTQSHLEDENERVFCCSAYVLNPSDVELWTEWTEAQKEQWEEEHREESR